MQLAAPDDPRAWTEIPVVVLTGIALGLVIIWAAIRYMGGRKK
jgi:hypothetical protein